MKQYTTPEQTAELIELGFERPFRNEYLHIVEEYGYAVNEERNFSIGELIEILLVYIERIDAVFIDALLNIGYDFFKHCWVVAYIDDDEYKYRTSGSELIDALYDMVCKLKESRYARR